MSPEPRRVLLVEDNAITRRSVRRVLERHGLGVTEAENGAAALRAYDSGRPELILLDLRLPDVDGLDLLGTLRARPGGTDVPILAFSGLLTMHDAARISGAGFDDVIPKPIEPAGLVQVVNAHLPRREEKIAPIEGRRRVLLADDDPVQLKLAALKLSRLGYEVERAPNGMAALEAARRKRPDVVVSDIMMPELDGFGLCIALRREPSLANLPIILATSTYVEGSDRELARRAGATDYVVRTPDLEEVIGAVRAAIDGRAGTSSQPPLPPPGAISAEVEREHMVRIVKQLERQVQLNAAMGQRCATLGAALSVLTGIADSLVQRGDLRLAIDDVLAACFDAGGISVGVLELRGDAGQRQTHVYGIEAADVRTGFTEVAARCNTVERLVLGAEAPAALGRTLAREGMRSALLIPLIYREERIGTLLLAASAETFDQEEGTAFARGIASQITQAVALTRAFAGMERAQREAREHARVLQSVIDGVAEGIVMVSDARDVSLATKAAEVILGGRPSGPPERWPEQLGLHASDMVTPFPAQRLPVTRALAGEIVESEEIFVRRGERWVQMTARPLVDDAGRPRGAVAVVRDITREKSIQMQLMVADRMVTVGTLAAGVAHEINNPLAAVLANLDFMASVVEEAPSQTLDPDLVAATDEARDAASRVRDIVRDLRIFSRAEVDEVGPVDVHRTLDSSARMAWTEIKHRARLVKDYTASTPALANEARLGQVFLNLIVNAAQAIPLGRADENEIRLRTLHDADRNVVIEVTDTGTGMSPDVLGRVFTPFFTTKPAGIGTGLGLSICKRLVTAVGGTLTAESKQGAGTTFRVTLPTVDPTRISAPRLPPRLARARRARVLVIDDDPLVLSALRRRLGKLHEVSTVHDAREALELLGDETFDAVLCDLMMPVMSGIDFYREVQRRSPDLVRRIVFATGGAFTAEARSFLDSVKNLRLEKPFTPDELDRALERVLADRAA